jgi:hypothetical protein
MDPMIESKVRQHLRGQQGGAQCARCVATALHMNYESIRAAMNYLAPRQSFSRGPWVCGARGLSYGWSGNPSA